MLPPFSVYFITDGFDDPAHVGAMPRIVLVGVFGVEGRETAAVQKRKKLVKKEITLLYNSVKQTKLEF